MHLYDSLIIGSGYTWVGFALKRKNCIICEESQCCDPNFYLPLRSFNAEKYVPVTEQGKKLASVFNKYELFNDEDMCANALEPAFCEFLSQEDINVLLKCRVIDYEKTDDGNYKINVITAEGISTLYAKNVFDSVPDNTSNRITVVFSTENSEKAISELSATFKNAVFSKAFYKNRYAMFLPVHNSDVNEMICYIHDNWKTQEAKVLYIPAVFSPYSFKEKNFPADCNYTSPLKAFEAGVKFSGGEK